MMLTVHKLTVDANYNYILILSVQLEALHLKYKLSEGPAASDLHKDIITIRNDACTPQLTSNASILNETLKVAGVCVPCAWACLYFCECI